MRAVVILLSLALALALLAPLLRRLTQPPLGATRTQQRLRGRFLRFVPIRAGDGVLEVGCGTGVVIRDLAALVGRRGSVVGVDPSRLILGEARRLCRGATGGRITLREGNG